MVEVSKYKQMFVNETLEQINEINITLSAYQKNPDDIEAVNTLFRSFHSIKGMAASMAYEEIQNVSHKLEDLLDGVRNGTISYQAGILDVLYDGSQLLEKQVNIIDSNSGENVDTASLFNKLGNILSPNEIPSIRQKSLPHPMQEEEPEDTDIVKQDDLKLLKKGGENYYHIKIKISAESISPPARAYLIVESLKIKENKTITIPAFQEIEAGKIEHDFEIFLGTNLNKSEVESILKSSVEIDTITLTKLEIVNACRDDDPDKLIFRNLKTENTPPKIEYRKPSAVKVETHTLNSLIDIVGEMFIQENQLMDIAKSQESPPALIESINRLEKLVRKLYKEIMTLRLIPLSMLSDVIPRVIREVLKDTKKIVDLEITGKEIKLDRAIVEKLGDPLIHLIRNCLDHGIESPEERTNKGKPETGKLIFSACKKKENIIIELSDDGKGLDPEAIRKKIADMKLLSTEELMKKNNEEVYNYIWLPGFSTASKITTVSGRGVGMDIVKNVVEGVGGKVWATSTIDQGCKFHIQVPLTMAIIKTFRITLNDELFAIPLNQVIRAIDLPVSDIRKNDQKFFFEFQEKEIEVFDLKELFNYGSIWNSAKKNISILVVETDRGAIGLMVDSFLSGYETVTKPLGIPLEKLEYISGASVSEKGDVILLIDVEKIVQRDRHYH